MFVLMVLFVIGVTIAVVGLWVRSRDCEARVQTNAEIVAHTRDNQRMLLETVEQLVLSVRTLRGELYDVRAGFLQLENAVYPASEIADDADVPVAGFTVGAFREASRGLPDTMRVHVSMDPLEFDSGAGFRYFNDDYCSFEPDMEANEFRIYLQGVANQPKPESATGA